MKVVIAEDDYRIGNIHEEIVQKAGGFEVVEKTLTGKDTLEVINKNSVDLLLLDVYMSDMLGTELLWELRKNHFVTDAIVITAAVEKEIILKLLNYGVFDIILKPVEIDRLFKSLEHYRAIYAKYDREEIIDQSLIDAYFFPALDKQLQMNETPKGIDPITLDKVSQVVKEYQKGLTADELAEITGMSRTTTRRYLEYLISLGQLEAELEYGLVGRPVRKYKTIKRVNSEA